MFPLFAPTSLMRRRQTRLGAMLDEAARLCAEEFGLEEELLFETESRDAGYGVVIRLLVDGGRVAGEREFDVRITTNTEVAELFRELVRAYVHSRRLAEQIAEGPPLLEAPEPEPDVWALMRGEE